jgi:glutathione synthase/RimK-type ligase-like ATP-grasp enzyme
VINDPFWWNADEKFFECTLARRIGVAVPKTVVLPNKEYEPGIDPNRSLRNMQYPVDWEAVVSYIGLPAVLKPNTGGGWRNVYVVWSMEELLHAYDQTGQLTMILQEFIDCDDYVHCIVVGEDVLPIRYDPKRQFFERYRIDEPVQGQLRERAIADARTLTARWATTWTPSSSRSRTGCCTRSTSSTPRRTSTTSRSRSTTSSGCSTT